MRISFQPAKIRQNPETEKYFLQNENICTRVHSILDFAQLNPRRISLHRNILPINKRRTSHQNNVLPTNNRRINRLISPPKIHRTSVQYDISHSKMSYYTNTHQERRVCRRSCCNLWLSSLDVADAALPRKLFLINSSLMIFSLRLASVSPSKSKINIASNGLIRSATRNQNALLRPLFLAAWPMSNGNRRKYKRISNTMTPTIMGVQSICQCHPADRIIFFNSFVLARAPLSNY